MRFAPNFTISELVRVLNNFVFNSYKGKRIVVKVLCGYINYETKVNLVNN